MKIRFRKDSSKAQKCINHFVLKLSNSIKGSVLSWFILFKFKKKKNKKNKRKTKHTVFL